MQLRNFVFAFDFFFQKKTGLQTLYVKQHPIYAVLLANKIRMTEYVGVLLYILFRTGLGVIILFRAAKVAPRRLDLEKATAYECGFEPFGEARSPFDVGFYLVAILF